MINSNALWTYSATAVICICIYTGIFHTHHYYKFDVSNWLYITIAICIVIIQTTSFEHQDRWINKLRAFLMVLVLGLPIVYCIHILQAKYCAQQLENHGITTTGKVLRLFKVRHGSGRRGYVYYSHTFAEFEYKVNGRAWKQMVDRKDYDLNEEDEIELRCSSVEPEIFEVLSIKKKVKKQITNSFSEYQNLVRDKKALTPTQSGSYMFQD